MYREQGSLAAEYWDHHNNPGDRMLVESLEAVAGMQLSDGLDQVVSAISLQDARAYRLALNQCVLASVAQHGLSQLRQTQPPLEWGWVEVVRSACKTKIDSNDERYLSLLSTQFFSKDPADYRLLRRKAYGSCDAVPKDEDDSIPEAIIMANVVATRSFNSQ